MSEKLTITIQMESDWHIGTGSGQAKAVDRLVRKDKHGLPIIPGKTLKGILKDSAEVIAGGLGSTWPEWVSFTFGDSPSEDWDDTAGSRRNPEGGALDIRSANLSDALRAKLLADQALIPYIYSVRPGVALTKDGVAKDDHLRLEERTRGGLTLTARISLEGDDEDRKKAKALLAAAAAWTQRLGGKRRRGSGKCCISISGMSPIDATAVLEEDPGSPPESTSFESEEGTVTEQISTFRLKLRTLSPLCLTRKVEGNVVFTNEYISGGMLMGAIGQALGKDSAAFWKAVDEGKVRVGFATPRLSNVRGLPMPFAIEAPKGGAEKLIRNGFSSERDANWKQARRGFWAKSGDSYTCGSPPMSVVSHNVIQDEHQRPTKEVGGVYAYESIDPGTPFECLVTLPKNLGETLIGKSLKVGRSKSVEYGEAEVESVKEIEEASSSPEGKTSSATMLVVSPLLLRDSKTGAWTPTLERLVQELEKMIRATVKLVKKVELRPIEVQSWNVRGRTPRPSAVGLQPGSCLMLEFEQEVELSTLRKTELTGLGERLAEGFGEVAFNPVILTLQEQAVTVEPVWDANTNESLTPLKRDEEKLMQSMCKARLLQEIRQNCLGRLATKDHFTNLIPKNPGASQLGILRSLVASLPDSEAQLKDWILKADNHKNRPEKWGETLAKIKELLSDPRKIRPIVTPERVDDSAWDSALDWQAIQIAYDAVLRFIREDERRKETKKKGNLEPAGGAL